MWRIALLGAESSGKSTLAVALAKALQQRAPQHSVCVVDEYLRTWCVAHGRTPQPQEQAHIARIQAQRIEAAATTGAIVIADTTPLMTAIYSEFYFADHSLYPSALRYQQQFDLHLLLGTDLPWQADAQLRDGPATQAAMDTLLRTRLNQAGLRFHTIYGPPNQRLDAAWSLLWPLLQQQRKNAADLLGDDAIKNIASTALPSSGRSYIDKKHHALYCAECSDPDCERILFSRLLDSPRSSASPSSSNLDLVTSPHTPDQRTTSM